jgi:putative membrane protein
MKYKIFLLGIFLVFWSWAAWNPVYPHDWLLENYLVFLWVPIIIASGYYFRLSNISYTLITIFMCLHVVGSHYTYAEVPFGETLKVWFDADRNMYDRLVHFSFGLLLFYPIREIFMRLAKTKGFWSYYFPWDLLAALAGIYEIIEWQTAVRVNPEAGLAFLGTQGDVWDAQKDMGLAILGAFISLLLVAIINSYLNKNFWKEMKASFSIPKGDRPLGEIKIEEYLKKRKAKRK